MSVYHECVWCPWWLEEGIRVTGTGVPYGSKSPYECWKLNPGHLEEKPALHF